jgi:hypothetical protein
VPKWALELLNGDSQSFDSMAGAVNRMNQELARILGVEHLLLGSDGGGSLALARSKVGTFYLTVTSTLLDLLEIYDRDLIAPLAELNGWPEELWPQMGVNEISDRDLEQVLDALAKLAQAGAPDDAGRSGRGRNLRPARPDPAARARSTKWTCRSTRAARSESAEGPERAARHDQPGGQESAGGQGPHPESAAQIASAFG